MHIYPTLKVDASIRPSKAARHRRSGGDRILLGRRRQFGNSLQTGSDVETDNEDGEFTSEDNHKSQRSWPEGDID